MSTNTNNKTVRPNSKDFFGRPISANLDYYYNRINSLKLTRNEARRHGLSYDQHGNIIQYIRHYNGENVQFLPRFGKLATLFNRVQRKNENYDTHYTHHKSKTENKTDFLENAKIVRLSPDYLEEHPHLPKYLFASKKYTGLDVLPLPTNLAIDNFNNGVKGGTIYFTEGLFKAISASLHGFEFVAFSGITTFKLDEATKEYLKRREPENVVMLYDGDAKNISTKKKTASNLRPKMFKNSANKFGEALFDFFKDEAIKAKVYFAQLKDDIDSKGLDDLIQNTTDDEEREAIFDSLRSFAPSKYFEFIRLFKSKAAKQLDAHFNTKTHADFYAKFKNEIKEDAFVFDGAKYRLRTVSRNSDGTPLHSKQLKIDSQLSTFKYFELLNDPFEVDIDTIKIYVNKYVSEAAEQISQLLNDADLLAINAPTGSGKTSFFIRQAIKTKTPIVVTVPTVLLCKQLAEEYKNENVFGLYGNVTPLKQCRADAAQIVFCTYDVLHRVNVSHRVSIVDESHNLINSYSYRAEALRRVVEISTQAQKTVFISGTQSKVLANELGFVYVDIEQKDQQKTNVISVETKDTQNAILHRLSLENWQKDEVKFCYINDTKRLHEIAAYLVKNNILKEDDIEVITSDDVKDGVDRVYKQILKSGKISGVKLVLSTCLLAEGISILNTNIGNIYTVDINCVDSFKQYSARFRRMKNINVYAIRKNERRLAKDFLFSTRLIIDTEKANARLKIKAVNAAKEERLHVADFDEEDFFFFDEIEPKYNYKTDLFNNIYLSENGEAKVDILRILSNERSRKIYGMNNAAFYTELAKHSNINLQGNEAEDTIDEIKDELATIQKDEATKERDAVAEAKFLIHDKDGLIFHAAYFHAKKRRSKFAEFVAKTYFNNKPPKIFSCEALQFYKDREEAFCKNWYTPILKAFLALHYLGIVEDNKEALLDNFNKTDFKVFFNRLSTLLLFDIYEDRKTRRHLSKLHKIELRLLAKLRDLLSTELVNDSIEIYEDRVCNFIRTQIRDNSLSATACKNIFLKFYAFDVFYTSYGKLYRNVTKLDNESHAQNAVFLSRQKIKQNECNLLNIIELKLNF